MNEPLTVASTSSYEQGYNLLLLRDGNPEERLGKRSIAWPLTKDYSSHDATGYEAKEEKITNYYLSKYADFVSEGLHQLLGEGAPYDYWVSTRLMSVTRDRKGNTLNYTAPSPEVSIPYVSGDGNFVSTRNRLQVQPCCG